MTDNGLTKTCPETCDSRVTSPAHPPNPQHTICGTLPMGMALLPSPPFAEREREIKDKLEGEKTANHSSTQLHTHMLSRSVFCGFCLDDNVSVKNYSISSATSWQLFRKNTFVPIYSSDIALLYDHSHV